MHFFFVVFAISFAYSQASTYVHSNIDTDVYVSNLAVGGGGGKVFTLEKETTLLDTLVVYRNNIDIRGLMITLFDGSSLKVGTEDSDTPVTLDFHGARITQLIIYYAKGPQWPTNTIKGLFFSTTDGIKAAYSYDFDPDFCEAYDYPVGFGYCTGAFGSAQSAIDRIGFTMLKDPAN